MGLQGELPDLGWKSGRSSPITKNGIIRYCGLHTLTVGVSHMRLSAHFFIHSLIHGISWSCPLHCFMDSASLRVKIHLETVAPCYSIRIKHPQSEAQNPWNARPQATSTFLPTTETFHLALSHKPPIHPSNYPWPTNPHQRNLLNSTCRHHSIMKRHHRSRHSLRGFHCCSRPKPIINKPMKLNPEYWQLKGSGEGGIEGVITPRTNPLKRIRGDCNFLRIPGSKSNQTSIVTMAWFERISSSKLFEVSLDSSQLLRSKLFDIIPFLHEE